ncbi:DNA binding methylated-DNA--cysteine S-methyltransferase [Teratosphaeria destructans]|uniref:Methylated-DNA--protein-cysteine methyltransferase n=1 Tax=Teratosphaeria destructans TaxID=418781 RepID=A0A9W7W2I4_9PEZI|nr:DNA binding methylated-DNA--cysteine S-methyltransferase [Teratosphaeria destructans]
MFEEQHMAALREGWNHLYKDRLPALARARDPAQARWPVYLDHCFARIILDAAVGHDQPWPEVIKAPAVKHMTQSQLESAIDLGEKIATGKANLVDLDNRSLEARGKKRKADAQDSSPKKRLKMADAPSISKYFLPSPPSPGPSKPVPTSNGGSTATIKHVDNMQRELDRIRRSDLTAFRKQTLTLLCQVPRGRYSTYQAMSDHITQSSHKTCARAVGNAMRNNPFAPEVPCHRILAADGTLGGFGGHWGESGRFASKKRELLYEEGVRFDSKGRVKGPPFREFKT